MNIQQGDTFSAYVKKGKFSRDLSGRELAWKRARGTPSIAEVVSSYRIIARSGLVFKRADFMFVREDGK